MGNFKTSIKRRRTFEYSKRPRLFIMQMCL